MAKVRQARKCQGRKQDGSPCGAYAIQGSTVCRRHGGDLPSIREAAQRRVVEDKIERVLARMDVDPVKDPVALLALMAGRAASWCEAIAERVNELTSLRYSTEGGEQLRAEIALWERAMDRCEKFAHNLARLNLDERLVKVEERQVDLVKQALAAALADMGLGAVQQREAMGHVARHLRAVAS